MRAVFRSLASSPPLTSLACDTNIVVPDIVHSTAARVCEPLGTAPAESTKAVRSIEAVLNSWKPCPVVLRDMSLVVERTAYYLHGVPQDVILKVPTESLPAIKTRTFYQDGGVEEKRKKRGGNSDFGAVLVKLLLGSLLVSCLTVAVVMHHSAVITHSKRKSP